jgi:hypothetical protein
LGSESWAKGIWNLDQRESKTPRQIPCKGNRVLGRRGKHGMVGKIKIGRDVEGLGRESREGVGA